MLFLESPLRSITSAVYLRLSSSINTYKTTWLRSCFLKHLYNPWFKNWTFFMRLVYFLVIKNSWQLQIEIWLMSVEATLVKIIADTNNFSWRIVLPPDLIWVLTRTLEAEKRHWEFFMLGRKKSSIWTCWLIFGFIPCN